MPERHPQTLVGGGWVHLHTDQGVLVGIQPLGIQASLPLLDTPLPAHGCTGWSALRGGYAGGCVTDREAHLRRFPWVGASLLP